MTTPSAPLTSTATAVKPAQHTHRAHPGAALAASLLGFFVITLDALILNDPPGRWR